MILLYETKPFLILSSTILQPSALYTMRYVNIFLLYMTPIGGYFGNSRMEWIDDNLTCTMPSITIL